MPGIIKGGKLGSFLPTDISNCSLWLDANDSSSITLNGSNVSQWDDKSGNGNHVAQAVGANQPIYNATGWTGNMATINFNEGKLLNAISQVIVIPEGDCCLFAVTNPTVVGDIVVSQWVTGESLPTNLLGGMSSSSSRLVSTWEYASGDGDGVTFSNIVISSSTDAVFAINRNVATNTCYGYSKTSASYIEDSDTYVHDPDGGTDTYLCIGSLYGVTSTSSTYNGLISEIIIYQKFLEEAEIRRVVNFLATKWGI